MICLKSFVFSCLATRFTILKISILHENHRHRTQSAFSKRPRPSFSRLSRFRSISFSGSTSNRLVFHKLSRWSFRPVTETKVSYSSPNATRTSRRFVLRFLEGDHTIAVKVFEAEILIATLRKAIRSDQAKPCATHAEPS